MNTTIQALQQQRVLLQLEYYAEKEAFRKQTEQMGMMRKVKRGDAWFPLKVGKSYYNSLNQLALEVFRTTDQDIEHNFEFGRPVVFFKTSTINHQPSTITYHPADYGLHYATNEINDSIYQAPSRMDEFIAKMANYNKVIGVPLNCATAKNDSTVSGTAYVFEDKEDFDVFGRLLQMACWYDSKSPGYMLNFSHQQFVFTLKDLHKEEKYFWLAERITGKRILLYCTHSPIETDVSFACYQNFREQLTNVYFSSLQY